MIWNKTEELAKSSFFRHHSTKFDKIKIYNIVEGEKMTELEKTYLVAGNIAKAIARGEWKKENIYSLYSKYFEDCTMKEGKIFIGKLKTHDNENNIALELYYSLSRYYKVTELPFIRNDENDHAFRF